MKRTLKAFLIFYVLIPLAASIPGGVLSILGTDSRLCIPVVPLCALLLYLLFRKKLDFAAGAGINGIALLVLSVVFAVLMGIARGNVEGTLVRQFCWLIFPFGPCLLILILMNRILTAAVIAGLTYLAGWCFCTAKTKQIGKRVIPAAICVLVCTALSGVLYVNRPAARYSGHGFDYMHGYSSTDFTDYTVYAEPSKLYELPGPASLVIEKEEEMPVLDGAEACYPLYAALAKEVYQGIGEIEKKSLGTDTDYKNGKIVSFTNTIWGFQRLVDPESKFGDQVDLFFGARPSKDQLAMAAEYGTEVVVTPIGREAFVFFTEKDNPVEGLTSEQIRSIYHGDITDWSEVGGKRQKITAFQRPENSGSQTMMEYFMGEVSLREPDSYEVVDAMGGVVRRVAEYANERGALGYTFRYFLEELQQEKNVKMLSVDGVYPTPESIEDGSYPLTVDLCVISRKDDPNPNVQKMIDYLLSEEGQSIVRGTGYGGLSDR